ncbi:MAG: Uma2 family endonuclease [Chloroflexi bacterium]|nr:Uma2 family endonuclease [Chloroflexota bacterium]
MTTSQTLVTAEELVQLSAEGKRYELVKGELRKMAPTGGLHGDVANMLGYLLRGYVLQHRPGYVFAAETGFRLHRNPDTVLAPDAAFVARERLPDGPPVGYVELAPDLAAEVVSPSDTAAKVHDKVEDWLEAGVKLVWVVYPERRSVAAYRSLDDVRILREGDTLAGEPALPGFRCPVRELFQTT